MNNTGTLKVHCILEDTYKPISGVSIEIFSADRELNDIELIGVYTTDANGMIDDVVLETPDINNSKIQGAMPYGVYNMKCSKNGYKTYCIRGLQIFPNVKSKHECFMEKGDGESCGCIQITIPEHKQVAQGCSKCKKDLAYNLKLKPVISNKKISSKKKKKPDKYVRILENVEVPQFITVHCGSPSNSYAANHTVNFIQYVKNVASSELYPTWNPNALRANIYCIVSFALNRVYTEWYPSRGYKFDITNDTAYDQAFFFGRTTYDSIDNIVDQLFSTYIQRWGDKGPLLAEFCNGTTSTCPNWLSQWGSQYLAENGYYPYEILTYYYGQEIDLVQAEDVNGYPESYPGTPIELWSTGQSVKTIQSQLNRISINYPAIPKLDPDGIYGPKTQNSVEIFQGIFGVPKTGIVNYATWYAISRIYVGVTDTAELN